jgi:hypothetical protein
MHIHCGRRRVRAPASVNRLEPVPRTRVAYLPSPRIFSAVSRIFTSDLRIFA